MRDFRRDGVRSLRLLACASGVGSLFYAGPSEAAGAWSDVIPLQNVPVAAALLNNGLVLTWSAYDEFWLETDIGDRPSQTYTGLFDPQTGQSVGGLGDIDACRHVLPRHGCLARRQDLREWRH